MDIRWKIQFLHFSSLGFRINCRDARRRHSLVQLSKQLRHKNPGYLRQLYGNFRIVTRLPNPDIKKRKKLQSPPKTSVPGIMADKRKEPPISAGDTGAVVKRQRQTTDRTNGSSTALTIGSGQQRGAVIQAVSRTSALRAPIMELTGHGGEVFACRFDETGNHIASGSFDRTIRTFSF